MADKIYRNQPVKKSLSVIQIGILLASFVGLIILTVIVILSFKNTGYQPPQHEKTARRGMPNADDSYMFSAVKTDYGYKFYMAANLYQQENGTLNIFFTNYEGNSDLLKVEIVDRVIGDVLYSSGFLYPGEYVTTLEKAIAFANADYDVTVMVYAFERDTFESKGTTYLNLKLHGW